MADIFAEVDDALKQEKLEKLWQRHGGSIIAVMVAIIVATGANAGWKSWNQNINGKQTDLLLAAAEEEDMSAALEKAGQDLRPGLRGVALMTAAGSLLNDKKTDEALALYEKAAADSKIPAELRDLAVLMSVRLGLGKEDAAQKKDAFLAQLEPISSNAKSPWRYHADLEAATILAHFGNDYAAAQTRLENVLMDKQLPESLIAKARALSHVYGLRAAEAATKDKEGDKS